MARASTNGDSPFLCRKSVVLRHFSCKEPGTGRKDRTWRVKGGGRGHTPNRSAMTSSMAPWPPRSPALAAGARPACDWGGWPGRPCRNGARPGGRGHSRNACSDAQSKIPPQWSPAWLAGGTRLQRGAGTHACRRRNGAPGLRRPPDSGHHGHDDGPEPPIGAGRAALDRRAGEPW